ncbi:hypothetical protein Nit79A3_1482 [Nitrosomonas sp. Is79A3]
MKRGYFRFDLQAIKNPPERVSFLLASIRFKSTDRIKWLLFVLQHQLPPRQYLFCPACT